MVTLTLESYVVIALGTSLSLSDQTRRLSGDEGGTKRSSRCQALSLIKHQSGGVELPPDRNQHKRKQTF